MKLENFYELYQLISEGIQGISSRKSAMELRKTGLKNFVADEGTFIKQAFDTRRINQETDFIPRRGLQNYHRSEEFVSQNIANKVKAFSRLAQLLDQLKLQYGKEPEWQDSYTRVLASAVHKGLRTDQLDGDYSDAQPSMASLDYLEELLFVRYRLTPDSLLSMADSELQKVILNKDELLLHITGSVPIAPPSDVSKFSYDQMMDKMLNTMAQLISVQKNNQSVEIEKPVDVKSVTKNSEEKTVTITIKV